MDKPYFDRTSDRLAELISDGRASEISLGELIAILRNRAFGVLLVLFALPNMLPMPPGIAALTALVLMWIAGQLVFGREILWFPAFVRRRRLRRRDLERVVRRIIPWVRRIEAVCRPRLAFATEEFGRRTVGVVVFVLAFILLLPIPFLGNLPPAVAIIVIGVGFAERDGVIVVAGVALSLLATAISMTAAAAALVALLAVL